MGDLAIHPRESPSPNGARIVEQEFSETWPGPVPWPEKHRTPSQMTYRELSLACLDIMNMIDHRPEWALSTAESRRYIKRVLSATSDRLEEINRRLTEPFQPKGG